VAPGDEAGGAGSESAEDDRPASSGKQLGIEAQLASIKALISAGNTVLHRPDGANQKGLRSDQIKSLLRDTTNKYDVSAPKRLEEGALIESRQVLRYLFYKEQGFDPGPLSPLVVKVLAQYYLVDYWVKGRAEQERLLRKLSDDERVLVKARLATILQIVKPFLDRWGDKRNSPHGRNQRN